MILFSLPVHEEPAVIENQLNNFIYYNPNCKILLHVSAWMNKQDYESIKKIVQKHDNVYINKKRLWTGHLDGSNFKTHVVNYMYAQQIKINFKYFCIQASNDMFVRPGLLNFIKGYDTASYYMFNDERKFFGGTQFQQALKDKLLRKIMKKHNLEKIICSQVEGSFYTKDIMDIIIPWIWEDGFYEIPRIYAHSTLPLNNNLARNIIFYIIRPLIKGLLYAKEEIYFSTLAQHLVKKRIPYSYCFINWANGLKITKEEIDLIRAEKFSELPDNGVFTSEETPQFFCVKRIERKIDDPLRQYITSLQK